MKGAVNIWRLRRVYGLNVNDSSGSSFEPCTEAGNAQGAREHKPSP